VQTDTIAPGFDTIGNGIPDAWQYLHFGSLGIDPTGDGATNLEEDLNGPNPLSRERLAADHPVLHHDGRHRFAPHVDHHTVASVQIEQKSQMSMCNGRREPTSGVITPLPSSSETSRNITAASSTPRFYRVRAIRPLMPSPAPAAEIAAPNARPRRRDLSGSTIAAEVSTRLPQQANPGGSPAVATGEVHYAIAEQ